MASDAHPAAPLPDPLGAARVRPAVDGVWPSDHYGVVADLELSRDSR